MDKVLSARVDEAVLQRLTMLAGRLRTSKKAIIERAILAYAERVEAEQQVDLLEQTHGAWQREDSADETVERARSAFRQAMDQHRR
jgi:predicted transcriptional regulator